MKILKAITSFEDEREPLKDHVFATYNSLRMGMGILSAGFPLTLYIIGKTHNIDLQGSMSAYYWAGTDGIFSPRTVFTGTLLAIAAFLYLYKGFSTRENVALNLAAIFASMVAFFPMSWKSYNPAWNPHGFCAIALFACLAYVSFFCARDTLSLLHNEQRKRYYTILYRITGILMLLSPIGAAIMRVVFNKLDSYTYFVELTGILAFALYWIAKSIELHETGILENLFSIPMGDEKGTEMTSSPGNIV
jgi:hypothetical protein